MRVFRLIVSIMIGGGVAVTLTDFIRLHRESAVAAITIVILFKLYFSLFNI